MRQMIFGLTAMIVLIALIVLIGSQPATAVELSDYVLQRTIDSLEAPGSEDPKDFSGATFVDYGNDRRRVFIVDNKTNSVYEYDLQGKYQRTIRGEGFDDVEGIAYLGNDKFAIIEERRAEISIVTIDATTKSVSKSEDAQVIKPRLEADGTSLNPDGGNSGLEGIGYDTDRNVLYVVKEKGGRRLYEVRIDGQPGAATRLEETEKALKAELDDFSGLHFDNASKDFFVISHESNRIVRIGRSGPIKGILSVEGRQVEGVAMSPDGTDLVVVGEARQFTHFQLPQDEEGGAFEPAPESPPEAAAPSDPPAVPSPPAEPKTTTSPVPADSADDGSSDVGESDAAASDSDDASPSWTRLIWIVFGALILLATAIPFLIILLKQKS